MLEKFVDKQPVKLLSWHHSTKTVVEWERITEFSTRIAVEKSSLTMISTKYHKRTFPFQIPDE